MACLSETWRNSSAGQTFNTSFFYHRVVQRTDVVLPALPLLCVLPVTLVDSAVVLAYCEVAACVTKQVLCRVMLFSCCHGWCDGLDGIGNYVGVMSTFFCINRFSTELGTG